MALLKSRRAGWTRRRRRVLTRTGKRRGRRFYFTASAFQRSHYKFRDVSSFRSCWSPHVESPAAYLDKKAQRTDSIYTVDWGIRFQLMALYRPNIWRKVKDSWPTFLGWSPNGPDGAAEIARVFPLEKKAPYVGFVAEESVFSQAPQNFK